MAPKRSRKAPLRRFVNCARSGLVQVGVVAVDGTKIAAAATHHATRSYEEIAREILEDAARIDAAEDELYGDARGDELPEQLRTGEGRRAWLRERGLARAPVFAIERMVERYTELYEELVRA